MKYAYMFPDLVKGQYGMRDGTAICFAWEDKPCVVCGAITRFNDEMTGWTGVETPLCSEECSSEFWNSMNKIQR